MKFFIVCLVAALLGAFLGCCIARADDIDWEVLTEAVIEVESGGDPNAVSGAGAVGLMQITPVVVREFRTEKNYTGEINLFTTYINKYIGTWYLHRLHDHYGWHDIDHIAAAYNGGTTRLKRCGGDISKMPAETRAYVLKVKREYEKRVE